MPAAQKPTNEQKRLEALRSYHILDTHAEEEFDNIVKLAAHICNSEIALISLVDENRQWFKAKIGVDASETSRDVSFCAHAILKPDELFVIEDATQDERFRENSLVTAEPYIRFYAGQPLVDDQGFALGTLCVIDCKPHTLNETQRESLNTLAKYVVTLMSRNQQHHSLQETVEKQVEKVTSAKDLAENAHRLQSEFLSNMSHELRTPIHAILNLARICEENLEENAYDKQKQNLRDIELSSERLLHLLNNLLDLSKLESQTASIRPERTNMHELIRHCIAETKPLAEARNVHLEMQTKEDEKKLVTLDRLKIQQVLVNLLSNAIKFSPKKSNVTVDFSADNEHIYLQVIDNGIGIPKEERENIFNKFVQSSLTKTGAGGTGLGLSICREIVNQHGGKIWVENRTDKSGAVFFVTLPQSVHPTSSFISGCIQPPEDDTAADI